jgi:hypothetical protein
VGQFGFHSHIPFVAGRRFQVKQAVEEGQIGPFVLGRLLRDSVHVRSHAGQLQLAEMDLHSFIDQLAHGPNSTRSW